MGVEVHIAGTLPIVGIVVGMLFFWIASRGGHDRMGHMPWPRTLLRALGVTAMLAGAFALIGMATHVFFVVAWIVTAVILVTSMFRYYNSERHSLIWMLTVAAERGIPLNAAVMAFAEERNDRIGLQAAKLADYLEAGVPLGLALKRSGTRVSYATSLAADLGQQTGTLGTSLREASQDSDLIERTLRSTALWFFYLGFLAIYMTALVGWSWQFLIPKLSAMYRDFELQLPSITAFLMELSSSSETGWLMVWLFVAFAIFLLVAAFAMYTGVTARSIPLIRRIWWRIDSAMVLRWLATAIEQQRPVADMLQLLAGYFPSRRTRRKLEIAAGEIARGRDWTDALRRSGIIRRSEGVLFQTAERAGNLDWALGCVADNAVRRATYRIRVATDVIFPLAVVAMGGLVLFLAIGLLFPIFGLVMALS